MKDNIDYKADLKERISGLKIIEGFPIGDDEDILALSNPPYYTACPNPYVNDFFNDFSKPFNEENDNYQREPFVADVSYGKNDPLLNAHFYHTKVPPKAIEEYILHYTNENDIILDGFCGTGTTGIAANRTNRKAVLFDISPIANFIAHNQTSDNNLIHVYERAVQILKEVQNEFGWLYETTKETKSKSLGEINYVIWSDIFKCSFCSHEYNYWKLAVKYDENILLDKYTCPNCGAQISKENSEKVFTGIIDKTTNTKFETPKQEPVIVSYLIGKKKVIKFVDEFDILQISKIDNFNVSYWFPTSPIMFKGDGFGDLWRAGYHKGYTNSHHFYTKRNLIALSALYNEIEKIDDIKVKNTIKFIFTSVYSRSHRMNRYIPQHGRHVGPLSGTLYMSNLQVEINVFRLFDDKLNSIIKALNEIKRSNNVICSNQSIVDTFNIPNNSVDYIFTDPPFGDNLPYSELNFILEDWLKIHTNTNTEAIINLSINKDLSTYHSLMLLAFNNYYKALKPKRWITIVFHNSKSSVWAAIQEAITKAGFIISSVAVLDKKKGTTKQLSYQGAVKNDLVISAYKPSKHFEDNFLKNAGIGLESDFLNEFLTQQPVRPIIERTEKMLYSKMLSYYIQHGYEVRYDAKAFYQLLHNSFAEEDGYWFNAGQINSYMEYKKKMKLEGIDEIKQGAMMMFVTDEKSALVWLHNYLNEPKSFSDIHTAFTQLANIQGDEVPDLKELLEQNFIAEDGLFRRPKNEPEHSLVIEKREKQLLRQFESLLIQAQTDKKKIKSIRKEAILLGFEYCYKEKRFQDILTLAKRFEKVILEENGELKEFIDAAEIMVNGLS